VARDGQAAFAHQLRPTAKAEPVTPSMPGFDLLRAPIGGIASFSVVVAGGIEPTPQTDQRLSGRHLP
jgi:hypothetical protein